MCEDHGYLCRIVSAQDAAKESFPLYRESNLVIFRVVVGVRNDCAIAPVREWPPWPHEEEEEIKRKARTWQIILGFYVPRTRERRLEY